MLDLSLLCTWLMFVSVGVLCPFVWSLGYIWVDVLLPHRISYSLLSSVPIAFIMGAGSLVAYLIKDRRDPPKISLVHVLCGVMAIWVTLTTTWAVAPLQAWIKWDVSFKTVVFVCFMPFVFRTRVQIEAFLLVFTFAASAHLIPWGAKTLLTGGGYAMSLGLLNSNSAALAESSTVAGVTVMFVPLLIWMRTHSILIPWQKVRTGIASVLTVLYLVANIGTFARTGLVGLALLGGGMLMRTRRKILFIFLALVLGGIMVQVTSDKWTSRIETISDYNTEGSALTRIIVWTWTLGFVQTHPLGGGFDAYVTNLITVPDPGGGSHVERGRAFHNIFFAALGEHGYPGLALYLSIMGLTIWNLQRSIKRCKGKIEMLWASDLARALQLSLLIILACGNFVDISFLYIIWDIVALGMCLNAHVLRAITVMNAPPLPKQFGNHPVRPLSGVGALPQMR